ncbi:uncharacterized protein G2W53_029232 [Senna tora]|uniref:Uncharacterized protein n=1 Tax=Senna tora TaxID=362788 RepID=A0A834T4Y5_9FABA|nr:uncharacterized protein G2W53_029232 [Senna tora]
METYSTLISKKASSYKGRAHKYWVSSLGKIWTAQRGGREHLPLGLEQGHPKRRMPTNNLRLLGL